MKLVIFLWAIVVTLAFTSCKPCETECKFKEGEEIEIKSKSVVNNNGIIKDVDYNMDCSCSYTVSHANMLNITYDYPYEEFELEKK
jgi:hypothetical protein